MTDEIATSQEEQAPVARCGLAVEAGHRTGSLPARKFAVIEAPSALGHIPTHQGVARTPDVLLSCGLADRLGARRAARAPDD